MRNAAESANILSYAFTPLLDESEDENDDEDVLYSQGALAAEDFKLRSSEAAAPAKDAAASKAKSSAIGDELNWIEANIPSFVDEDEEKQLRELEESKIQ